MKHVLISTLFMMSIFSFKSPAQNVPSNAEDIKPLLIGATLPRATLVNPEGTKVELKMVLASKPTVLVFYRGGWCPYCNMQLSGLVEIEKAILELGYQIVAISPDDYQNLKSTEEKDQLSYQLFSDPEGKFIKDVGIGFRTPTMLKGYAATKGQKGKTSDIMPVPTVMVVNQNGEILFEYVNPNYKIRISSEMLIAVLKTIN